MKMDECECLSCWSVSFEKRSERRLHSSQSVKNEAIETGGNEAPPQTTPSIAI